MDKIFKNTAKAGGNEKCLTCHEGIEEISHNHKFGCVKCHGGNANASDEKSAHAKMVSNPSDMSVAQKVCGSCHRDNVSHVSGSLMATAAGEINSTRYAWGARDSRKAKYATAPISGPADIFRIEGQRRSPEMPGCIERPVPLTGIIALQVARHVIWLIPMTERQDRDKAILGVKTNPRRLMSGLARIQSAGIYVQYSRCHTHCATAHCHSATVGTEYLGMTEHDYEQMYRSPRLKGRNRPHLRYRAALPGLIYIRKSDGIAIISQLA